MVDDIFAGARRALLLLRDPDVWTTSGLPCEARDTVRYFIDFGTVSDTRGIRKTPRAFMPAFALEASLQWHHAVPSSAGEHFDDCWAAYSVVSASPVLALSVVSWIVEK